jgi:hypothetical protein
LAIDSIANPHLNDDPGAIIAFPDETFGLDHCGRVTDCWILGIGNQLGK